MKDPELHKAYHVWHVRTFEMFYEALLKMELEEAEVLRRQLNDIRTQKQEVK